MTSADQPGRIGPVAGGNDVFLSYANQDRATAAEIAGAIEKHGFSVWWDVDIPAGAHFPKLIEDALKSSACVVVLWSRSSTRSRWVRNEANWGAEKEALVPVAIDDAEIPWEFRNIQTVNLSHWSGDGNDPIFGRLIDGIRRRVQGAGQAGGATAFAGARPVGGPLTMEPTPPRVLEHAGAPFHPEDLILTPLTGDGHTRSSCISPDGRYLAYVPMQGDRSSLRLKQIDTGNESVLVEEDQHGIRSPVFSPDGIYIYFAMTGPTFSLSPDAEYDLYRISTLGGAPQRIATKVIGRRIACSPDGTRLLYKKSRGDSVFIHTSRADGSNEQTLASEPRGSAAPCCLTWSKRGDRVVTTTRDPVTGFVTIVSFPAAGGVGQSIGNNPWQAILDIHSLADGSGLLVVGGPLADMKALNINLWFLPSGSGEFQRITNDLNAYYQVSADASGRRMALSFYNVRRILRVLKMARNGESRDVLTDVLANGHVVWAGPGRLLANQRVGNRIGVVSVDLGSGATSAVPIAVDYVADLDLSLDGQWLVYTSFQGNEFSVWIAGNDGGSPRRLTEDGVDEQFGQFSPDGSWIATMYRAGADKPWFIRRRLLASGETRRLSEQDGRWPRISPDGSLIAAYFMEPERNQYALAVIPSAGGEPRFLDIPETLAMLDWNRAGTGLTCFRQDGKSLCICDVPISGETPRELTEIPAGPETITDGAWNAAGDSLALCLEMTTFDVMFLQGFRGEVPSLDP